MRFNRKQHPRARIPVTRCLSAVIPILYVLFFCIKAHAQPGIDEPFGLSTMPAAQTAIGATWKELLVEITNDLSIVNDCRENPPSCSSPAAIEFVTIATKANDMKGWRGLGILIEPQTLQSGHTQMTNGDHPWQSSQGTVATAKTMQCSSMQCSESSAFHLMP